MGILATGVESIFNEPPLSYRSTKSVNLSLVQRNPDISLHYTQHQNEVILLFEAKDLPKAKEFATSADLRETMQGAGVVDKPDIYYLG